MAPNLSKAVKPATYASTKTKRRKCQKNSPKHIDEIWEWELLCEAYLQCTKSVDSFVHATLVLCGDTKETLDHAGDKLVKSCVDLAEEVGTVSGTYLTPETMPIIFVGQLFGMWYASFTIGYLPAAGLAMTSTPSIAFHVFFGMAAISYYQAVMTDPGDIQDVSAWICKARLPNLRERKQDGNLRWCAKCDEEKYKPDRAHHCRILGRCILRMDHHCVWIGNTVGFRNHKFFLLFIGYSLAAMNVSSFCACNLFFSGVPVTVVQGFLVMEAQAFILLASTFLGPYFLYHCWLLSKNMTTIEHAGKLREDPEMENFHSLYDLGLLRNVQSVLGEHAWLWLLPCGSPPGDGISWPILSSSGTVDACQPLWRPIGVQVRLHDDPVHAHEPISQGTEPGETFSTATSFFQVTTAASRQEMTTNTIEVSSTNAQTGISEEVAAGQGGQVAEGNPESANYAKDSNHEMATDTNEGSSTNAKIRILEKEASAQGDEIAKSKLESSSCSADCQLEMEMDTNEVSSSNAKTGILGEETTDKVGEAAEGKLESANYAEQICNWSSYLFWSSPQEFGDDLKVGWAAITDVVAWL